MQIAEDGVPDYPAPSSKSGGSAGPRAPFMRLFGRRIADLANYSSRGQTEQAGMPPNAYFSRVQVS